MARMMASPRTEPATTIARDVVCPQSLARAPVSPSRSKGAAYYTITNLEDYPEADCSFHLRARNSHPLTIIIIMLISTLIIKAEAQYSTSHCVTLPKITMSVFFRLIHVTTQPLVSTLCVCLPHRPCHCSAPIARRRTNRRPTPRRPAR